jgi:hypothetical protein
MTPRSKDDLMTSSGTSTESRPAPRPAAADGFQPWHFFILLSMLAATAAVWRSQDTHPAALLLVSGAVIAAGFVGLACYYALVGFFGGGREARAISARDREAMLKEKALVLRSIKELEFDRGMGKVSDTDFAEIGARLRARAMDLMQEIDAAPVSAPPKARTAAAQADPACPACGTDNDPDARFCKQCGSKL